MWLLVSLVLVQFLKAKADMEALAVSAVASPVAGDDDVNSLKVRPSMESVVYSFWVAGLVIYNIFFGKGGTSLVIILPVLPLWALGGCRMVLRFFAFHRATRSFAHGRNVQLIHGYMVQLQEAADYPDVPRLIVTGERKQDIEETPVGYRVKQSIVEEEPSSSLVTLDRIWSESKPPLDRDLCLSFALFKCLRRRFAGYPLAEAGSGWAFRFVSDGLLGPQDDHERIFRVIATELMFASDFYYSPLPVASLGSLYAGLYFLWSAVIFSWLCLLVLLLIALIFVFADALNDGTLDKKLVPRLPIVLGVVIAWMEMSEMLANVRSNWTKISIVGHYIRCHDHRFLQRIFTWLLRRNKTPKQKCKDEMGQVDLLANLGNHQSSCARFFMKYLYIGRQNPVISIKVPLEAKAAILNSFRSSGGQLSAGTAAVQRRRQAFSHDITWACLGGEAVTNTTDTILIWCVATGLFENRCSSRLSSSMQTTTKKEVAVCLSRYCMYLLAEVPGLLPDNSAWTKRRYQEVMESVKAAALPTSGGSGGGGDIETGAYGQPVVFFSGEGFHEVLKRGSELARQLLDEAEKQRSSEEGAAGDRGEDAVWEMLVEFWSEMLLYIAPST
nr:unnamed protein product [Digitaria exilis]